MKHCKVDQLSPTHVVASQKHCLTFNNTTNFNLVATEIDAEFGFAPASLYDLANSWTTHRPDLLIGSLLPDPKILTLLGGGVSLDPVCSVIARDAATLLNVQSIKRMLIVGEVKDTWFTPLDKMRGRIPSVLFHGTSDIFLDRIWDEGLRIDQTPNWQIGSRKRICMTATPQTAAFHARRTASIKGGAPIVIALRKPWLLETDWDVQNQLVTNPHLASTNAMMLTKETGLFASARPASRMAILKILEPVISKPVSEWRRIRSANWCRRIISWMWR